MTSKGDLTRQNIIEKSMDLFSVKGFFNTSIADIVQASGLTKGCLYGHFRNKEEIWYAVYDECVRIWKSINSLVDLAGVAPTMSNHVLAGFTGFAKLLRRWLEEAARQGMIKEDVNLSEVANFMVISVNGAAPLYAASKDPAVWQHTLSQLRFYTRSLRKLS
jgi:TetR/AcrR family transcriptional repressor of nem operon